MTSDLLLVPVRLVSQSSFLPWSHAVCPPRLVPGIEPTEAEGWDSLINGS